MVKGDLVECSQELLPKKSASVEVKKVEGPRDDGFFFACKNVQYLFTEDKTAAQRLLTLSFIQRKPLKQIQGQIRYC